ncbi:Uncharacterised protein [Klebsiella pneumoniae]|uniref:Uncharacterized protein n=1 Tax=Klebsiella pneumoniae TaxID=573 RepID=A0A2X1QJW1_KLEPN|nr:Uncharacterised protein [Klebsiella pneumoniae]
MLEQSGKLLVPYSRANSWNSPRRFRWRLGQRCRIQPHPAAGRGGSRRYGRRLAPTPPDAGYRCPGRKPKDGLSGRSPPVQNRFLPAGKIRYLPRGMRASPVWWSPPRSRLWRRFRKTGRSIYVLYPARRSPAVKTVRLVGTQQRGGRLKGIPSGCARRWPWPSTRPTRLPDRHRGEHREPRVFYWSSLYSCCSVLAVSSRKRRTTTPATKRESHGVT